LALSKAASGEQIEAWWGKISICADKSEKKLGSLSATKYLWSIETSLLFGYPRLREFNLNPFSLSTPTPCLAGPCH
jgi:hypothetical protein